MAVSLCILTRKRLMSDPLVFVRDARQESDHFPLVRLLWQRMERQGAIFAATPTYIY
jgi:hypothetical protein